MASRSNYTDNDWGADISPDALAVSGLLRAIGASPDEMRSNRDLLSNAVAGGMVAWQLPTGRPDQDLDDDFLRWLWDVATALGPLTILTAWTGLPSWSTVRKLAAARGVDSVLAHLGSLSSRHQWRSTEVVHIAAPPDAVAAVLAVDRSVEDLLDDATRPTLAADVVVVPDMPEALTSDQVAALSRSTDASAVCVARPDVYNDVVLSLADAAAEGQPMSVALRQIARAHPADVLVLTGLSQDQFRAMAPAANRDRGSDVLNRHVSETRGPKAEPPQTAPTPTSAAPDPPPPASEIARAPRWILANVFDLSAADPSVPTPAFHAGAEHEIRVIIGAEQADWLVAHGRDASESIDSMLPQGTHELTIVFFVPNRGTQTAPLILPPSGPSPEPAKFRFTVGDAGSVIQALISIVHRGRVLQIALLSGTTVPNPLEAPAAAGITLRLQVVVPGLAGLDYRQEFDAALVAATDVSERAVAAGIVHGATGAGETVYFENPGIHAAAKKIRNLLEDVVADPTAKPKLDSAAGRALLWKLAQEGRLLFEEIGQRLERDLAERDLSRLQLVQADARAFIPIEFVYSLPTPMNGAGLCANWKAALTGTPCNAEHHKTNALGHLEVVCPSGFWGVSKLIERQILKDTTAEELRHTDFGVRAEPSAERPSLAQIHSALFAWSEIANNTVAGTSAGVLRSLNVATGQHAAGVKTWLEWAEAISAGQPELLVLLSHTVDDALEIGPENSGERATLAQINSRFVKRLPQDAPIVFLLGCTTAVADDTVASFVGRLRDQGAALVVGTITPVLGERSAAVVKAVITELVQKKTQPIRFGEAMRRARCHLLLKGELTALCATSFGDASWLVS